jgi:hypothetical protein
MGIVGEGLLVHHSDPDCVAGIALAFSDASTALEALVVLGEGWTVDPERSYQVIWHGGQQALEALIERLKTFRLRIQPCGVLTCAGQCVGAEINNRKHPEKYGVRFQADLSASTLAPLGRTVRIDYDHVKVEVDIQ